MRITPPSRPPRFRTFAVAAALCLGTSCGVSPAQGASAAPAETFPDFTADGTWCWFSDPRAVAHDGRIFAGWMTEDGSVQIGAWEQATGKVDTHVLHPQFERDDHDHPALVILPDGRLAAFYSPHAWGDMRMRITARPGDISAWTPERSLDFVAPDRGRRGTTYANPILLSGEANALYIFWRGSDFKPTFAISRDLGATWSAPRTLIARPGADDTNRPYVKYRSNGVDRIDFAFTDGHPRNESVNSVYYVRYERGSFFKADGTRLGGWDDVPLDPARCDKVYDGSTQGRAWIWDVAVIPDGRPAIAYTRLPAETDHRYALAHWDGAAWRDGEICAAGGWFPQTPPRETEREPHYSGGMALDPRDPFTAYTSRRIDGIFEIERWRRTDADPTWTHNSLTTHSRRDNVRPVVIRQDTTGEPIVLWLNNERYIHYTNFRTAVKAAGVPLSPP